jgi:hypothetical protein
MPVPVTEFKAQAIEKQKEKRVLINTPAASADCVSASGLTTTTPMEV